MRKSGWAAAAGLGSLLLLAACGGSSPSNTGLGTSTTQATASGAPSTGSATSTSATPSPTADRTAASAPAVTGSPHPTGPTAGPQPSSKIGDSLPPVGTTIMIVQKSDLGYVLAEANGQVVYTYSKDKKDGPPSCTGTCAETWIPVTGVPQVSAADTLPEALGTVTMANGGKQVTYDGYPLYTYKGANPYTTTGNGVDGEWSVVKLSESDITG